MSVTIYHNPRCSKSRETLAMLESRTLTAIVKKLRVPARKLLRTKEVAYLENGLDNEKLTDAQIIAAIVNNPILMERPIVLANDKAAIGRPPENVLEIL